MNKKLGMIGSIINAITVLLFAIFMGVDFNFGSYFVCILLSLSFVMMIAAFENECSEDKKVAGKIALVLSGVYSTLIMIVYFTQCTSVIHDNLNLQAAKILNYSYLGLMFNLDLLGYAIMALSTFFIGFTINDKNKKDKAIIIAHTRVFLKINKNIKASKQSVATIIKTDEFEFISNKLSKMHAAALKIIGRFIYTPKKRGRQKPTSLYIISSCGKSLKFPLRVMVK